MPYEPYLAIMLSNLSNRYEETGRVKRALDAAGEAVDIHTRLAERDLTAYGPDLVIFAHQFTNALDHAR